MCFVFLVFGAQLSIGIDYAIIPGWYTIEPWEIEVCRNWGGSQESQTGYTTNDPFPLSRTTLTLQGRKTHGIQGEPIQYKIAYYLEPLGSVGYQINFVNSDGDLKLIKSGTATNANPAKDLYVVYNETDYPKVRMNYGGNYLEVPIIEIR